LAMAWPIPRDAPVTSAMSFCSRDILRKRWKWRR
jgi:hypothetical protein